MKISNATLAILKNYASINSNILIREGNVLATVSAGKNILSRATVFETFPKEFAIYDLNSFLATLSLMEDQDVEFGDSSLVIKGNGQFEYMYADPSVVVAAPDKTLEIEPFYSFELTSNDLSMIMRSAGIVDAPTLTISSSKQVVTMTVGDPGNAKSNSYKKIISAKAPVSATKPASKKEFSYSNESIPDFTCRLKIENIKVIPDTYQVSLGKKKAMHLNNGAKKIDYWLAMEPSSIVPA
jgi:hypothetical protein